jgi:hypothetical protein
VRRRGRDKRGSSELEVCDGGGQDGMGGWRKSGAGSMCFGKPCVVGCTGSVALAHRQRPERRVQGGSTRVLAWGRRGRGWGRQKDTIFQSSRERNVWDALFLGIKILVVSYFTSCEICAPKFVPKNLKEWCQKTKKR